MKVLTFRPKFEMKLNEWGRRDTSGIRCAAWDMQVMFGFNEYDVRLWDQVEGVTGLLRRSLNPQFGFGERKTDEIF